MKRTLRSLLALGLPLLLAVVTPPAARAQTGTPGSADPAFSQTLNTEGSVIQVVTQPDGKIVALGNFPPNNNAPSFRRLNADGTLDTSFATTGVSIPGRATAFALQADGKVFYGGTGASGVLTASLGRLKADGTQDATFQPPTFASVSRVGDVLDVAVQANGKLIVAGNFSDLNGTPRPGLARLNADGSVDTTFVPPSTGIVFSSAQAVALQTDGKILAAGSVFIGTTESQGIVRLNADGTQDSTFTPQTVNQLTSFGNRPAIAVQADGKILFGGAFSTVGTSSKGFIARLLSTGSVDGSFSPFTDAPVLSIVVEGDGKILIGGGFVNVSSLTRRGVARLTANGGVDTTFDPGTGDGGGGASVRSIAVAPNGKVIVAGGFGGFGTSTRDNLALLLNDFTGLGGPLASATVNFTGVDTSAVKSAAGQNFSFKVGADSATGTVNVRLVSGGLNQVTIGSSPDATGFYALRDASNLAPAIFRFTFSSAQTFTVTQNETVTALENEAFSLPSGAWKVLSTSNVTINGSGGSVNFQGINNSPPYGNYSLQGTGTTFDFTVTDSAGLSQYGSAISLNVADPVPGGGTTGAILAVTDATEKSTSDATGATAVPSDKLTYTFTVRNTGAAAASNIALTAILNGVTFKSATAGDGTVLDLTPSGSQLVFPRFTLAAGASLSFNVKAKVPATFPTDGRIVGFAVSSVTADGATPLPNQTGLNSTVLPPYQTLVSYNSNVGPGDVLTFRFTTTNRSTATASGITSVIAIPTGVKFLSVNTESGAVINVAPDGGGNLRVVLPDLAPNSVVVYSLAVRIPYDAAPNATFTLLNTQLVVGGTTYGEPGVTLSLNGNAAAAPPKLTLSKSIVDADSLAGLFLFDPARAAKLAAAFPVIAFYTTDATGTHPNGPAIQAFGAALNPFIGENDTGVGAAVRSVTSPSNKQPVTYVTFVLLYENTGASSASDFNIVDRVPAGFAYVPTADPATLPGDLLPAPYAIINGVPVTPDVLQVTDNGRTLNFRVKAKLKPGQNGLIVYQLQVVPTASGGPNPGATVTTTGARITSTSLSGDVTASPDGEPLLISSPTHFSFKTFLPDNNRGDVGRAATFQFYYKNDGGKKTTDFAIRVATPAGATFASANVVSGAGANGVSALPNGGGALFTIGKVKPGESGLVQVRFIPTAAVLQTPSKVLSVQFVASLDGTFSNAAGSRAVPRLAGQPVPHLLGVDPVVPLIVYRPVDPSTPRLFIQRSTPLVVEFGKPFSYVIVVGNLGDSAIAGANITDTLPKGLRSAQITGNDGPVVSTTTADGRFTYSIPLNGGIPAHSVRSVKIQLNASPDLFNTSIPVNVTDDSLYATSTAAPFPVNCPPAGTRLLKSNETLALVGSQPLAGGLLSYGLDASAVNTVNKAVTANSRMTTVGGADVLTTNNGALVVPLGSPAKPAGQVVLGSGPVLVTGPVGVVSNDGGSLISQDGGGLVAQGAGNLIRLTGLISQDGGGLRGGSTQTVGGILAGLISQDGGGLVAQGAGNILRGGGLNLISQDGGGVISNDGGSLIAQGAGNLVAQGAGNLVATGFSNLITDRGGSIFGDGGSGLIASSAGNFLVNGGGKLIATGGGNAISDNGSGLIGSSPNTAALVATGGGNLVATGGGNLVAQGAGN